MQGPLCVVGTQELVSEWIVLGFENSFAFSRMDVAARGVGGIERKDKDAGRARTVLALT